MTAVTESDIKEIKDLITAFQAEMKKEQAEMKKEQAEIRKEFAKEFAAVREDIKRLEIGQVEIKGDIKALEATISGLVKRVDNQELTNRGILIALIVAIVGGVAKLFGWVGTP